MSDLTHEEMAEFRRILLADVHDLMENDEIAKAKRIAGTYGLTDDITRQDALNYLYLVLGIKNNADAFELAMSMDLDANTS